MVGTGDVVSAEALGAGRHPIAVRSAAENEGDQVARYFGDISDSGFGNFALIRWIPFDENSRPVSDNPFVES